VATTEVLAGDTTDDDQVARLPHEALFHVGQNVETGSNPAELDRGHI
jgi:hypothetical protein